ncbi:hypothetical protein [Colwellia psychrerythraea]|uniref:Uncharacterized protein n=1 Tax=Colwellia psychrerythraea TaxID=28229 RepID=A0A099KPU0_COLPS|nr:hypothetical protein [Colwellia psychrerythraea]KGJ91942.1 hypothetical protein GAB14E_3099 [Colwellia psychrerythraea]
MQDFLKKNNTAIVVGLITTVVFLYILQPILEFTGSAVLIVSSYLSSAYVDIFFTQIAHLEIRDFGFFFYTIMYGLLIGLSIGLIFSKWKRYEKSQSKENAEISASAKLRKKITSTIILSCLLIFGLVQVSTKTYQLSLISSFKQHLRIIAPYIDDQTEELLLSEWSLINSNEDYDSIYFKINNIAKKHKLELPDNSIYSLTSL